VTERTQTEVAGVRNLFVGMMLPQPGRLGRRAVYADAHLTHHEGEFETVTHEKISQYDEVSISWTVYAVSKNWTPDDGSPERDDQWITSGQVPPEERRVIKTSTRLGLPDRQALEQLWVDWHLNGMKSGCAHMPTWEELEAKVAKLDDPPMQYNMPDVAGWAIKNVFCPETQPHQSWGSRWWVKPLPADRRERFLAIIEGNQR
jgi:hypothetical protein